MWFVWFVDKSATAQPREALPEMTLARHAATIAQTCQGRRAMAELSYVHGASTQPLIGQTIGAMRGVDAAAISTVLPIGNALGSVNRPVDLGYGRPKALWPA